MMFNIVGLVSLLIVIILGVLLLVLEQDKAAATPSPVRIERDDR